MNTSYSEFTDEKNNFSTNYSYSSIGHANISIIGCGGAGNNTIDRLMKIGIKGARCIAVNTDLQHLNSIQTHERVLIGEELTRGLGAGGDPEIGRMAAEESSEKISSLLTNSDLIFITCGMGGGTGTGSASVVAEISRATGAIVVGVVSMPFKEEMGRKIIAQKGIEHLRQYLDTLIIIDNNRLLQIAADLPIDEAFSLADEVLATMVKGITETISLPSLINLDYADIRAILTSGGVAIVGIGESDAQNGRVEAAIHDALNSPLLDFDINGAKGALIHVSGGKDLSLKETTQVANIITEKLDPSAKVIWGARMAPELTGILQVMIIVTGVKSHQIIGSRSNGFIEEVMYKNDCNIPNLSDEFFNIKEVELI